MRPQDKLKVLHEAIDQRAKTLEDTHAAFLTCKRGCSDCCRDELTVFSVEANRIRTYLEQSQTRLLIHPEGSCAFLNPRDKSCQIYEARPYVCRTQGLPLRFFEETDEGLAEFRDICPLNDNEYAPIEALPADDCWEIGPTESELYGLTREESTLDPITSRVALRALAMQVDAEK